MSTNSGLSATAGSPCEMDLARSQCAASLLNGAFREHLDVEVCSALEEPLELFVVTRFHQAKYVHFGENAISTPSHRRNARRSRQPPPWLARRGGCGP